PLALKLQWYGPQGPDIAGDVFTCLPITTRRCTSQTSILVTQADSQTIEPELSHVLDRIFTASPASTQQGVKHALTESMNIVRIKGIAQRPHGNSMTNTVKGRQRLCANTLRR